MVFCKGSSTTVHNDVVSPLNPTLNPGFITVCVCVFCVCVVFYFILLFFFLSVVSQGNSLQALQQHSIHLVQFSYWWYFSFLLLTMLLFNLKHCGAGSCCFGRTTEPLALHLPPPLVSHGSWCSPATQKPLLAEGKPAERETISFLYFT